LTIQLLHLTDLENNNYFIKVALEMMVAWSKYWCNISSPPFYLHNNKSCTRLVK